MYALHAHFAIQSSLPYFVSQSSFYCKVELKIAQWIWHRCEALAIAYRALDGVDPVVPAHRSLLLLQPGADRLVLLRAASVLMRSLR